MIVGGFGDLVFETSDKRILTFQDFRRDVSTRYSVHERIGQKPISQYAGPDLDKVSFSVQLHATFDYVPNDIIDQFIIYCRNGEAYPLVIGPKTIGMDKWHLISVGIPVHTFGREGEIVSSTVELSFQEYLEVL